MKIQNVLIKIACWLIAISIVVIIALSIYGRHIIKEQFKNSTRETVTKTDSPGDPISGDDTTTKKDAAKSVDVEDIENKTYPTDIFRSE